MYLIKYINDYNGFISDGNTYRNNFVNVNHPIVFAMIKYNYYYIIFRFILECER